MDKWPRLLRGIMGHITSIETHDLKIYIKYLLLLIFLSFTEQYADINFQQTFSNIRRLHVML